MELEELGLFILSWGKGPPDANRLVDLTRAEVENGPHSARAASSGDTSGFSPKGLEKCLQVQQKQHVLECCGGRQSTYTL